MPPWNGLMDRLRPRAYGRRQPLILMNGLAEQHESWFRNRRFWGRYFDVYSPQIIVYDGESLHERIGKKEPISVEYLVEQYRTFLTEFVQNPPYHLVASSLGGKIAVELAVKYPELVSRVVLLCPSGMGDQEQLPIIEGVVRGDMHATVKSVFHQPRFVDRDMVRYYKSKISNRKWKTGLLRTVRGTLDHTVRGQLKHMKCPTLFVTGEYDKVCDPKTGPSSASSASSRATSRRAQDCPSEWQDSPNALRLVGANFHESERRPG